MKISFGPLKKGSFDSNTDAHSHESAGTGLRWPIAVIASTGAIAGCTLFAVVVWQVAKTVRKLMETRAAHHQLEELSVLTQRAVASTEATATELARVSHNVTDLRIRLDDIEQLLRTVE